jgi:hypothetical protein
MTKYQTFLTEKDMKKQNWLLLKLAKIFGRSIQAADFDQKHNITTIVNGRKFLGKIWITGIYSRRIMK